MHKELIRETRLIPKNLQIRFKDNKVGICYSIRDNFSGLSLGDAFVNFTPSKKLLGLLKTEINIAIKKDNE